MDKNLKKMGVFRNCFENRLKSPQNKKATAGWPFIICNVVILVVQCLAAARNLTSLSLGLIVQCLCTAHNLEDLVGDGRLSCLVVGQL